MNNPTTFLYIGSFDFRSNFGTAKRAKALALILKELGYDICFLDIIFGDEFRCRAFDDGYNDFRVFEVGYMRQRETFFALHGFNDLVDLLKGELRGIIYYHFYSWISYRIRNVCKKNNLLFIHDVTEWYYPVFDNKKSVRRALVEYITRSIDIALSMRVLLKRTPCICISQNLTRYYAKKGKACWLPFVTEKRAFQNGHTQNEMPVCFISAINSFSLAEKKERFDWVLEAIYDLMNEGISFVVHVYGMTKDVAFALFPEIEDKIAICSGKLLMFHGQMPNAAVLRQIALSDYAIFAREQNRRTSNGFPTKLSEAFACSTPVVTTPAGDAAHFVINGKTGYCAKNCTYEDFYSAFRMAATSSMEQRLAMQKVLTVDNPLDYSKWVLPTKKFIDHLLQMN